MKVTFIVGNGLDISLGMKTSYAEFYEHVRAIKPESKNTIYEAIMNDNELWSDFEIALGKHTEGIEAVDSAKKPKFISSFFDSYDEVIDDLVSYLTIREEKLSKDNYTYSMRREDFFSGLKDGAARKITQVIQRGVMDAHFITLNYTDTLQSLLYPNVNFMKANSLQVHPIHHAHGSLAEYITIGVNDETQISAAFEGDHRDNLIKSKLLESMDDDRLVETERTIEGSAIIVLFGVSLGSTDAYIWRRVIDWLQKTPEGYVVLHDYSEDYITAPPKNPIRIKQLDSEARDRLLVHYPELTGDQLVELRSRILVVRNTKRLFTAKKKQ